MYMYYIVIVMVVLKLSLILIRKFVTVYDLGVPATCTMAVLERDY